MITTSCQSVREWRQRSKCARCKYRMRWFSSKGAFLVLAWFLLVCVAVSSSAKMVVELSRRLQLTSESYYLWLSFTAIPSLMGIITLILSGWLADAKLGNFKVARFGFFLVFIATLCGSVYTCLLELPVVTNLYFMLIFWGTVISIMAIGVTGVFATSLQLGLDQIPDASSSQITSFIAWFVFCLYAGSWISDLAYFFLGMGDSEDIAHEPDFNSRIQLWSLHPVLCMAIVLILYFLLPNNWLIIEPKSPQSLRTIYQVVKFAAKHKAPLNRSALTYWEEDIPSRMDLGKSRYGGPFTTEQVEDVKTILRLLTVSIPVWMIAIALSLQPRIVTQDGNNLAVISKFTYNFGWCSIIGTLIHEFVIYPVVGSVTSSIFKRIGLASFLITATSVLFLVVEIVRNFYGDYEHVAEWITIVLFSVSKGWLTLLLFCALLELVCAQAPYNMRGLFAAYMTLLTGLLGEIIRAYSKQYNSNNLRIPLFAAKLIISLFGFILYCLLARWYKRRVRDDVFSVHTVVEEVYDRYLTPRS